MEKTIYTSPASAQETKPTHILIGTGEFKITKWDNKNKPTQFLNQDKPIDITGWKYGKEPFFEIKAAAIHQLEQCGISPCWDHVPPEGPYLSGSSPFHNTAS